MDLPDEVEAYARADFREVNARFVDRLLELAGPGSSERTAVDLGCGPGDIPLLVGSRCPNWRVTGVDASKPMLDVARSNAARAKLEDRVTFHLSDATSTALPGGSFDVVFSNSLLHHVKDPSSMWREIRRLAARGAVVFLRDLKRPVSEAAARDIVAQHAGSESKLLKEEFFRSLLAAYTVEEVHDQLSVIAWTGLTVAQSSDRHLDVFGTVV
jgi:ubiquinone/menaquinone biosynthesis C-methylase UbiE